MANFFIDRPIFAWVLAILLCLTGVLAITSLPVEQYPIWHRQTCASPQTTLAHRHRRWKIP
jgi:multidrug efflux pump subunit AcrB